MMEPDQTGREREALAALLEIDAGSIRRAALLLAPLVDVIRKYDAELKLLFHESGFDYDERATRLVGCPEDPGAIADDLRTS